MQRVKVVLSLTMLLCTATIAMGYHGSAPFDTGTRVTFEGVMTRFDYRNPHSLSICGPLIQRGTLLTLRSKPWVPLGGRSE